MSKTEDFENQIVTFGIQDGDLEKYAKPLRYIHGDALKQQHCCFKASPLSARAHRASN